MMFELNDQSAHCTSNVSVAMFNYLAKKTQDKWLFLTRRLLFSPCVYVLCWPLTVIMILESESELIPIERERDLVMVMSLPERRAAVLGSCLDARRSNHSRTGLSIMVPSPFDGIKVLT